MTKIKFLTLAFLFFLSVNLFADEIKFTNGTFKEVLSKTKKENKILMVDFFTDWCKWCVELDNKVYTDKDVADLANTKQVNWKIDAEKGEGVELAKKYGVSGFPTIVFIDGDGNEIDRIVGYLPAKEFLKIMKDYNEGKNTTPSLNKILKNNPEDAEANYMLAEKKMNAGDVQSAKTYLQKVISSDPQNKAGYTDDAELMMAYAGGDVLGIITFLEKYPNSNKIKEAYINIAEACYQGNNNYDSAKIFYDKAFGILGKNDDELNFSYGQYLLTRLYSVSKKENASDEDIQAGIKIADECYEFVKGSVNEGSLYYYYSDLYFRLKDIPKANEYIDKAIFMHDKKAYQDQKTKINAGVKK